MTTNQELISSDSDNTSRQQSRNSSRKTYYLVVLFALVIVGAIGYYLGSTNRNKAILQNQKQNLETNTQPSQATTTSSPSINKVLIPAHSDPEGNYDLYYTRDIINGKLTIKVYIEQTVGNKTTNTKVLELTNGLEPVNVYWPKGSIQGSKFILKTQAGDGIVYYLINKDGGSSVILDLGGSFNSPNDILAWLDGEHILVKHTQNNNDGSPITYSYWVAPVLNLSQKKTINFGF